MPAHPKSPLFSLSPDERFHQLAAILARGVLRIRNARVAAVDSAPDPPPEASRDGLEVSDAPWLSVVRGTTG
jgi:hypothetical protein